MVKVFSVFVPLWINILALSKNAFAQNHGNNCTLQLPVNPLSAEGLATPFILARGICNQTDPDHHVLVEATIFDPDTRTFAVYHPLVIMEGTQPAIKPVVPILSQNAVVSVWVQTKSNSITLTGGIQTCVGATCNAHTFFSAVRVAERGHGSILPPVGNDNMGRPCPKTHFVVQVTYLQTNGGRFAQATEANRNALKRFTEITSGLDIARKSAFPERSLGCTPLLASSMMEKGVLLSSMAMSKLLHTQPILNKVNGYPRREGKRRIGTHNLGKRSSSRIDSSSSVLDCLTIANTPPPPGYADNATVNTRFGPLSAIDRELVRKVRLATLWELPMAQEAIQRAELRKVKQISSVIQAQHVFLDAAVDGILKQLTIDMPTEPTLLQKCFIADIQAQSGINYDTTYVKWLRFAHGQVFETIGTVRSTSQNTVVRSFAETANLFVMSHMQMLEGTGLTQNSSYPAPPPVLKPSRPT